MTDTDKETKSDLLEILDRAIENAQPDGFPWPTARSALAAAEAAGWVSEDRVIEFMKFALERAASFAREVSPEAAGRVDGLSAVAAYLDAKRAFAASLTEKDKT